MLGWKMRRVLSIDQCLKEIPYPDPASTVQTEAVPCVFELPPYVFITDNDENQVGVWDEKLQEWCTDYIEDLEYRKKERELVFNTRKFAPIAYIQSKTTDFPYDSFYLRCIKDQVALLSIVTKRINVNIQIHPLFVKLIDMEQPELAHLVNKELHIGILLMELSKCGIHMLPENEDAARANIHLKDSATEERAILDIATTLKVFSFQSTKWCQQSDQENIVVRLRENPDNDKVFLEDDESDWKSIMWSPNKVSYIKCKNCDETFNSTIDDGQVTHAVLPLALKGVQSEDACERSQYTHDIDFIDNVQRTLRLLRLLSFTTNAYDKRTLEEQQ
jgi:cancer susceptibility candidate protein 1